MTGSALLISACGVSHLVISWTVVSPAASAGTWTLSWRGKTPKIGARCTPNSAQTPARLVGTLPSTRSSCPTIRDVPAGANLLPKMVAIPFGASEVTAGKLKPAPTTPPCEITGAVGETAGMAVTEKETLGTPAVDATIVKDPALHPRVPCRRAAPSFSVIGGAEFSVAAPEGLTDSVTMTPGTPAPVLSDIFKINGKLS